MGCCGKREKFENPDNEQMWDYINLSDFRSSSCLTASSYVILYILLLISVAVYAVDLFTCINLLLFDKWSGQVKPAIPFETSRWIFAACIILSWLLLIFRWWRAVRAMKSGVVAASYLDPLAVRIQSVRVFANGRGWRKFLVFAALTKGRKGAEYVALFTYFSFEAWLRICFAEGPRQVINALTLYSVMQADLVPTGQHAAKAGHSPVAQFFVNLQILADNDKEQAAILFGMLFTLIIWIFSALSLMMAAVFYITFLWHHIRDGSLSRYCRRKIDSRLHKIVMARVNRALEKGNNVRERQGAKGIKGGATHQDIKRQPTVPIVNTEDFHIGQPISRQLTRVESDHLGPHAPTPAIDNPVVALGREPTVPDVLSNSRRPYLPSRSTTQSSIQSNNIYADDAPLIHSAAPLGYNATSSRPAPSRMDSDRRRIYRPPLQSATNTSEKSEATLPASRIAPYRHQDTGEDTNKARGSSLQQPKTRRPVPQNTSSNYGSPPSGPLRVIATQEYEMQTQPSDKVFRPPPENGGYVAFNPNNRKTAKAMGSTHPGPFLNATSTLNHMQRQMPPNHSIDAKLRPPQRSGTAPISHGQSYHDDLYDAYAGSWQEPRVGVGPPRPATAGGWSRPSQRPMPRY